MDKHQKKLRKRYIRFALLGLLVALLAAMPLLAGRNVQEDGPQASILNTTLQQRTIDTQIIGGGQLASEGTEAITIPEAVKLTKYLVGNGDTVKKGDAIARVDKVSVMLALSEVQETLDYLSGQIAAVATEKDSDRINAQTAGTVKMVYGKAGDSVRDVMLEHGALAVISLDDRMAVEIPCDTDLTYGESVTVTLSSGKQAEGLVESNILGTITVTIEDKDYKTGETVTVSTRDGLELGNGELYIHSPWNASAYYGTIKKVSIKAGDKVTAGKALFQLNVGDHSVNFQILNTQRQEYEELMQELFEMYSTGVLSAPCDGFVTGVDKDGTFLLAAETGEQTWYVQPLSNVIQNAQPTYSVSLLRWHEWPGSGDNPGGSDNPGGDDSGSDNPGSGNPGGDNPENETVPPESTEEIYVVYNIDSANSIVYLQKLYGEDEKATYDKLVYPGTETAIQVGDQVKFVGTDLQKVSGSSDSSTGNGTQTEQDDATGEMPGGMGGMGGMGGFGGGGYSAAPAFEPYSLETITVASVTSQEEMTLEIAVDEQDIAKLSIGLEATVTVEALTGQTFPATVTAISNTGTNEGGSSKFTVKLTLSKAGSMLPGMNASAYLPLQSQSVTAIPVAALVEEGTETKVYTGYDEKNETLTNPVTVTTGVSDGEFVQILSGLGESDTVYYAYYDTPEQSRIPDLGIGFGF